MIGEPMTTSRLTRGWEFLGDVSYKKVEVYKMQWHSQSHVYLQDYLVAAAPFGGPIALLRNDRRGKPGEAISIYSASGCPIKTIRWEGGLIRTIGWSCSEELVIVVGDGNVYVSPLDPHLTRVKCQFTLGKEARDSGVIDARVFNSRHNGNTGVVVLTKAYRFFLAKSWADPKVNELQDIGLTSPPTCWQVVSQENCLRIVVAKDAMIYVVGVNERVRQIPVQFDSPITAITEMAVSFNQQQLALYADTGAIWLGMSDLSSKRAEHTIRKSGRLNSLVWCGKESVVATSNDTMTLLSCQKDSIQNPLPEPVHVVMEPDGCRIISSLTQQFIQKVPETENDICESGSFAPGRLLLEASEDYRKGSKTADDYLSSLKDSGTLDTAIETSLIAAGQVWDVMIQKALLKAVSFGKVFQSVQLNPDDYVNMCKKLRVLNVIRSPEIGMPLTERQYDALTERVIVDRLIVRQHWPIAQKISAYLKLGMENKILVHWACYKVEQKHLNRDEVASAIGARLKNVPGVQYSEIANRAADEGRKDLAVSLLKLEPRAAEKVPLLLKLKESREALNIATESGDENLVYRAIYHMKAHASGALNIKIREFPSAYKLYLKLCRESDKVMLENLYDQEDDHAALARLGMEEAKSVTKERKIDRLKMVAEGFRRASDDFASKQTELQVKLLSTQLKLGQKFKDKEFFDMPLNQTLKELLLMKEAKLAEDLRKEFMVPDRRWMWLRSQVMAETGSWEDLEKLSKLKRTPLIGFEAFADLCLENSNRREALKYILKLKDDPKADYILKYTEGDILSAAKLAHEQRDIECLQLLRERAIERPITEPIANQIDVFVSQLRGKK